MRSFTVAISSLMALAGAALAQATPASLALNTSEALAMAASAQAAAPAPAKIQSTDMGNFWSGWKRSAEIGVNGSEGNSQSLTARGALGLTREAADMTTAASISYVVGRTEDKTTRSRGEASLRNDWVLSKPWGFYGIVKAEYDEFQPWQWRLSAFAGPSYTVLESDTTLFKLRAGIGGSYEMGKRAEEEWNTELNLGFDLKHKFTQRTSGFITFDLYPSLKDWPDYRHVTSAGLDVMVDPEMGMLLKIGATNRYDSNTVKPAKKNDLDYFLTLAWTF
jgi:putative salt-induced outer membrane protein YdiY